jgi:hypothetical protein
MNGPLSTSNFASLWKRICLLAILVLTGSSLRAQEYRGTIVGQVTDPSGAVLPKASVTIVGPQQTYRTITGADGQYTIPFVQLGVYTVTIEASGFQKETEGGIHVDVASRINLNFKMQVGGANETVEVSSDAAALDTQDASGGTVMDPEKVQNLPLNGRQVYTMLALTPGVKFTTTQFGPGGNSGTRSWDETNSYSVNGQSGNYNQFALNGAPVSQQGGGGSGTWNIAPNLDAVEEFKIMTNTYDAQYGREAGGTVNTVLKSGTNQFHGTVYDFWRNSILEANTFQLNQTNTKKPRHNWHQFGGTVGGPIYHNKAYFFGAFEGFREILPVGVVTGTVTPDMLPGADGSVDLTNYLAATSGHNIYDPLTTHCVVASQNPCQNYTRDQFPNNTIPGNRISPIGLAIIKLWPSPNVPGNTYSNNYVSTDPGRYQTNQPIARVDYDFSDKTRFYGMFAWQSGTEYRNGSGMPGAIAQGNINNYHSSLTQVLDLTHTFSATFYGDIRASFNRALSRSPDGALGAGLYPALTAASLGLSMPQIPTTSASYAPEINMYNCCTANIIGNTISPTMFETYDLAPSISKVFGPHNIHAGAEFMLFHDIPTGIGQPNGQFTFASQFTQQNPYQNVGDGDGIAALLLGLPDSGTVDDFESVYESYNYYAGFAQDDWKILKNLTLNLGLRWENETSPKDRNNRLSAGFCTTCTNPLGTQLDYAGAAAGLPSPLVGGLQFASGSLSAYQNTLGTVLPKVGFAWLLGNQMVVRGGWGLSTALGVELGAQSTWQQTTQYTASLDGGVTPSGYFNTGTPYVNGFTAPPGNSQGLESGVGGEVTFDRRDRKIPRVQQFSFGFQGVGPFHSIWDLSYVGAHTTRLRSGIELNSITPGQFAAGHDNPSVLNQQVANPFYGAVDPSTTLGSTQTVAAKRLLVPFPQYTILYDYADPQGYSNYDSLQAKFEKRITNGNVLARGLSILASFTWSKTMSATNRLNNRSDSLVDPSPYYAVDATDRPWDFAFSGLYTLPVGKGGMFFANSNRFVAEALSDWQLDWIFTNDGGQPVNNLPNGDAYSCGTYNIRPGQHSYESWLNNADNVQAMQSGSTSCFQPLAQYTPVTQLPITTQVRAPWAAQTALGLEKRFSIHEGVKFQFKAEGFNVTNTPIFGSPNTGNVTSPLTRNNNVVNPNDPGAWSGYGTIGSTQQNFPRQFQLSGKILF